MPGSLFSENFRLLDKLFPEAAALVACTENSSSLRCETSKNGSVIVSELFQDRWYPLHSSVDPQKEAERGMERLPASGYLVCYGLGAGWHIRAAISAVKPRDGRILLLIDDPSRFRFLLSQFDFRDILSYPGLYLLISPGESVLANQITHTYLPGYHGNLTFFPLQGLTARLRNRYAEIIRGVQKGLDAVRRDFSVQAHFGLLWMRNVAANLPLLCREKNKDLQQILAGIRGRKVIITGAGPGLVRQLEEIRRLSSRSYLIATDTSLPVLLEAEICPDLVVNIDAQFYSTLHRENPASGEIPWILPVSASPALIRSLKNPRFFSSGHPLEQWICNRMKIPSLDTAGGNVMQTALSLAELCGASAATVFGADFSNPLGVPYAQGSYVQRWFDVRSDRRAPLLSRNIIFTYESRQDISSEELVKDGFNPLYPSRRLSMYKEDFYKRLGGLSFPVTLRGWSKNENFTPAEIPAEDSFPVFNAECRHNFDTILDELSETLKQDNRESLSILYPLAAYLRSRNLSQAEESMKDVIRKCRSLAMECLETVRNKE